MGDDRSSAYASAELGTELRGGPSDTVRSFAGLIDDQETIRLLNYYDDILEKPVEETSIGQTIIANASTQTVDGAVRGGNVSQMKAATGLTNQSKDGKEFYADVARELSHEGAIGLVFGAPGSGKTASTLDAALAWQIRTGGALIGNTEWEGFDRVVTSDREMLEAMAEIEGPVLALLDEIAQDLSGFGEGNKPAEAFSDSLLFIRKREKKYGPYAKRGSVLMTAHTRKKTAAALRRIASFGVEKPSRSNPGRARLLLSEGGKDTWEEQAEYSGLTDTAADYDEHEPSSFEVLEVGDDQDDQDINPEKVQKDEHIKTAIKACENGMRYDDVADLVPWSSDWVGKVYRKWRDENEYRDLVPAATIQVGD